MSGFLPSRARSAASLFNDLLDKKHRPPEGDMQARGNTDEDNYEEMFQRAANIFTASFG